jgi:hypothetical protein
LLSKNGEFDLTGANRHKLASKRRGYGWHRASLIRINERQNMIGTILLIVLVLLLIGALPTWPHSRSWGYAPSGTLGTVVLILLMMVMLGWI